MNLHDRAYYDAKLTSQYQGATKMKAWLDANLQLFQDVQACLASFASAFALATAVGAQLDLLGQILGQGRVVNFQPTGIAGATINVAGTGYTAGDIVTVVQGGGFAGLLTITSVSGGVPTALSIRNPGNEYAIGSGLATTGGTGTGLTVDITALISPALDDATYRTLLYASVARNHWDGKLDSLQGPWAQLFPGGALSIQDNQDMSATVILSGNFPSIIVDCIENGLVVPRPQGVLYTYSFPQLPMLGYDRNDATIAGWDQGHYT